MNESTEVIFRTSKHTVRAISVAGEAIYIVERIYGVEAPWRFETARGAMLAARELALDPKVSR